MNFSVGTAGDVYVAGGIGDFKAERTGDAIVAIEGTGNRRSGIAGRGSDDGG